MPHPRKDLESEKSIEQAFVKWAESEGYFALKLSIQGRRGFPDRTVFLRDGRVLFLEFKRPGGKPSLHQLDWIQRLKAYGHRPLIVYSVEEAKQAVEDAEK